MKKYFKTIVTVGIITLMVTIWCISNGVIKLNKIEAGIKAAYYNNSAEKM